MILLFNCTLNGSVLHVILKKLGVKNYDFDII